MIKPEQVPLKAIHALVMNLHKPWPDAIAAALNAWPNGYLHSAVLRDLAAIILPLSEAPQGRIAKQEAGDETVP